MEKNTAFLKKNINSATGKKLFSIRKKVIIVFGSLIAAAILIESVLIIRLARRAVIEKVEAHLTDKALDTAEIIDGRINALFQFLEGIARIPVLYDPSYSYAQRVALLKNEAAQNDSIRELDITDTKGTFYYDGGTVQVADRVWFQTAFSGKNFVSEPYIERANHTLVVTVAVPIGAFVMTMLASGILFLFASARRFNSAMLVLVGIALLFLFQSILSLIQFIAAPEISQQILFWLFGSLNKATWETVIVTAAVTAVCVLLLSRDVWKLTALRLGEERAVGLGINLQLLRLKTLVLVAVMTATAISFVGVIGFIGLVAPHVARILLGEDQRFFLPGAMLTGAAFLSVASVLSKVIIPGALFPVGIVTAFVGVPFFFWIVLSKR